MIEIVKADNLDYVCLQESNSFDIIYNDILFGTGRNFGDFKDIKSNEVVSYYHQRFLEMFRILKDSGVFIIHCDLNSKFNIYNLCIYLGFNFQTELVWKRSNGETKSKKWFNSDLDYILVFSKNKDRPKYNSVSTEREDNVSAPLEMKANFKFEGEARFFKGKEYKTSLGWKWSQKTFDERQNDIIETKNGKLRYIVKTPKSANNKLLLDKIAHVKNPCYSTEKPLELLELLLLTFASEEMLVGDFHGGSFTTAEACAKLGFDFKGCDISEKAVNIGLKRISKYENSNKNN